ncbi:MAG: cob(I)yrinic acid a,c-diamide adenosyltransferase [bacterium]|nr:cob(I)yrinic acid a,c-diamide adenosyltransferase [bacterium]
MREANGRGLVLVYTGDGKGKTTAAFGLALRAVGHGSRVFVIQFMKGDPDYGELQAVRRFLADRVEVVQSGLPSFVDRRAPSAEDLRLAREGLDLARRVLSQGDHDLVILDEINVAVDYGLISLEEVLRLLAQRPPGIDVVLTGRDAPATLLDAADLVSEVVDVKHHFRRGVAARKGVEF